MDFLLIYSDWSLWKECSCPCMLSSRTRCRFSVQNKSPQSNNTISSQSTAVTFKMLHVLELILYEADTGFSAVSDTALLIYAFCNWDPSRTTCPKIKSSYLRITPWSYVREEHCGSTHSGIRYCMKVGIISFTLRPLYAGGKSRQFDIYLQGSSVVQLDAHEDKLSNFIAVISFNIEL